MVLDLAIAATFSLSTGELKHIEDLGTQQGDSEGCASFAAIIATEVLKFVEKRKGLEG